MPDVRALLAICALLLATATARAEDMQSAKQHFDRGQTLYDLQRYLESAREYELAYEAKPDEHKLSNESPVGRALLGRKRNETVAVKVPRGPARKLKITKIDVGLE